ncbi:hypothetical protein F5Y08DRAFT_292230 [Xylaria arbuscula]|uniref:Uncharacterized protein n=1 Tax=Xylaria arbuscula TaxID=114810 RepID=A0A9W8N9P0_9PEZI|nr:hypothetical protein F5Y08DRAFT_292230 [Xylaria arbuscula]KAJ3564370.1 hypothetical protein NPX13_g7868 [Xylaria arbuscula]
MQHAANSSQQYRSEWRPMPSGSLHTPNQSFSAAAIQTPDSQGADWTDSTQPKDKDLESIRGRLSDSKFNIRDYADPLLPRQHSSSHYTPRGVTAELEKHLLEVIAKIKAEEV